MDGVLDSRMGIDDGEIRRNQAGTQAHLNRSRNLADKRYDAAVRLKEKVSEHSRRCLRCDRHVLKALTVGKLKEVTLETTEVNVGKRYTLSYKPSGFTHFMATNVDAFDIDDIGVGGYAFHDCPKRRVRDE
jgi:hypothetical protein